MEKKIVGDSVANRSEVKANISNGNVTVLRDIIEEGEIVEITIIDDMLDNDEIVEIILGRWSGNEFRRNESCVCKH